MKWLIGRKAAAGLGTVFVALALAGGLAYRSTIRLIAADDHLAATFKILQKLDSLNALLKDAESRQRGYIITGHQQYLDSYDRSILGAQQELTGLIALTSNDSILRPRIESIQAVIDRRFSVLKTELELRKYYGFDSALRWVQTGRGKQIMDEIDKLILDLETEGRKSLSRRQNEAEAEAQRALFTVAADVLAALLAVGIVGFVLVQKSADLADARRKLQSEVGARQQADQRILELAQQLDKQIGEHAAELAALEHAEHRIQELTQQRDMLATERAAETAARELAEKGIKELTQELNNRAAELAGARELCLHKEREREHLEDQLSINSREIEKYREFTKKGVDSAPFGLLTYKATGQCVSANDAAARFIGATTEQTLAQNFRQLESWRTTGLLQAAEEALELNLARHHKIHGKSTFGKVTRLDCQLVPFTYAGEPHLLVIAEDATKPKKTRKVSATRKKRKGDLKDAETTE